MTSKRSSSFYLITQLFHHHRAHDLRTLITIDEALLLFRGEGGASRISGNSVAELMALTREYGTGWLLTANAAHLLEPSIASSVFALIALNASSTPESDFVNRYCGLSKEVALRGLRCAQAPRSQFKTFSPAAPAPCKRKYIFTYTGMITCRPARDSSSVTARRESTRTTSFLHPLDATAALGCA